MSRLYLNFFIDGTPGPKGSMRGMLDGNGRPIAVPSYSKVAAAWEKAVRREARAQMVLAGAPSFSRFSRAFDVTIDFFMERPQDDFVGGTPGNRLKPTAPARPNKDPDIDKLLRATLDGLTTKLPKPGSDKPAKPCIWSDDNTVVGVIVREWYGDPESRGLFGFDRAERYGAAITITELAAKVEDLADERGIQGKLAL